MASFFESQSKTKAITVCKTERSIGIFTTNEKSIDAKSGKKAIFVI